MIGENWENWESCVRPARLEPVNFFTVTVFVKIIKNFLRDPCSWTIATVL